MKPKIVFLSPLATLNKGPPKDSFVKAGNISPLRIPKISTFFTPKDRREICLANLWKISGLYPNLTFKESLPLSFNQKNMTCNLPVDIKSYYFNF